MKCIFIGRTLIPLDIPQNKTKKVATPQFKGGDSLYIQHEHLPRDHLTTYIVFIHITVITVSAVVNSASIIEGMHIAA